MKRRSKTADQIKDLFEMMLTLYRSAITYIPLKLKTVVIY